MPSEGDNEGSKGNWQALTYGREERRKTSVILGGRGGAEVYTVSSVTRREKGAERGFRGGDSDLLSGKFSEGRQIPGTRGRRNKFTITRKGDPHGGGIA